jgi:uncharacterized protein (UPF0254 family)
MKYAVEMDSDAIIYVTCFIQIVSGMKKLLKVGFTDTQTT